MGNIPPKMPKEFTPGSWYFLEPDEDIIVRAEKMAMLEDALITGMYQQHQENQTHIEDELAQRFPGFMDDKNTKTFWRRLKNFLWRS